MARTKRKAATPNRTLRNAAARVPKTPASSPERDDRPDVPFPRSWWVRRPVLLAGCYPGSLDTVEARAKLHALVDAGIRTVVSLQPADETNADGAPFAPYEPLLQRLAAAEGVVVSCTQHPIQDCGVPSTAEMTAILDAMDVSISDRRPVYVHCWGGHGRTGTVVGCWLVRHGCSGTEALAKLATLRRHDSYLTENPAPQTEDQRQLVRDWPRLDPCGAGRHNPELRRGG